MKKRLLSACLALVLGFGLVACGGPGASSPSPTPAPEGENTLHILATTYPLYLFTTAITDGVDGVEVSLLVNQQTSCLHDYTLTVHDMKAIEKADVLVMNGVGLEDFMSDALAASKAAVIDTSEGIQLLEARGHEGHDHDTEYDPHIWMDPRRAAIMVQTIADKLAEQDPNHDQLYGLAEKLVQDRLGALAQDVDAAQFMVANAINGHISLKDACTYDQLITFHDGFQYFAQAFDLNLLKSIEEEEGSEASAADIKEIVSLIQQYHLPAIFTEKNGSTSTAEAISRETGCAVYSLDMIMSGDGMGIQPYIDAMQANINTILEALG